MITCWASLATLPPTLPPDLLEGFSKFSKNLKNCPKSLGRPDCLYDLFEVDHSATYVT